MSVETKYDLKQETIETLQDLIRMNIDSAKGFREASDLLDDNLLAGKLTTIANEREQQASVLQEYVNVNHDEPRREGSYAAALHRTWMNARAQFTSDNSYAVMAEAERGEDQIKAAYEDALKKNPGTAMNDVIMKQYEQVKSAHDIVRDLRDALK